MLTRAEVILAFRYDQYTGKLTWRETGSGRKLNRSAGTLDKSTGYLRVRFNGTLCYVHRLIWLYWYGYTPENRIDHIDKDRLNNSLVNLREVSCQCNNRNSKVFSNNTSGVKGVYFDKAREKWVARVSVDNKTKYIGASVHFIEAVCMRYAVEQCLDWNSCDKHSSACGYLKLLNMSKNKRIN